MIGWLWPDTSSTFGCRRGIYEGVAAGILQALAWAFTVFAGEGAFAVAPAVGPAVASATAVVAAGLSVWLWRRPSTVAAGLVRIGAIGMAAGLGTTVIGWAWLVAVALAVNGLRGAIGWRRMKRVDPDVEL